MILLLLLLLLLLPSPPVCSPFRSMSFWSARKNWCHKQKKPPLVCPGHVTPSQNSRARWGGSDGVIISPPPSNRLAFVLFRVSWCAKKVCLLQTSQVCLSISDPGSAVGTKLSVSVSLHSSHCGILSAVYTVLPHCLPCLASIRSLCHGTISPILSWFSNHRHKKTWPLGSKRVSAVVHTVSWLGRCYVVSLYVGVSIL